MVRSRSKRFYVIAYDIADERRRYKAVKILESVAVRINYSVFECMLTDAQYRCLVGQLETIVVAGEDEIVCYPICRRCFTRINYLFRPRNKARNAVVVV